MEDDETSGNTVRCEPAFNTESEINILILPSDQAFICMDGNPLRINNECDYSSLFRLHFSLNLPLPSYNTPHSNLIELNRI